jgi:HD-GYP domain-containing protein (c-di-GMP phosphodiesterase class II)
MARVLGETMTMETSLANDPGTLDRIAEAFALIIDGRSPYTYSHSDRVAQYAVRLGQRLGLPPASLTRLRRAALVHDLGKLTTSGWTGAATIVGSPGTISR